MLDNHAYFVLLKALVEYKLCTLIALLTKHVHTLTFSKIPMIRADFTIRYV